MDDHRLPDDHAARRGRRPRGGRSRVRGIVGAVLRRGPVLVPVMMLAVAGVTVAEVAAPQPAGAGGGDLLYPARDRYEPGQTVTMLGYGYSDADMAAPWRTTTFYGYLRQAEPDQVGAPPGGRGGPPGSRVGRVTVQEVPPDSGRDLRVSIEFGLPSDLAPGEYLLDVCDSTCTLRLGFFMASALHVGVDPPYQVVRDWPLTDPAIRWLDDGALLFGPDTQPVTAADVRAGRVPPPAGSGSGPTPGQSSLPEVTAAPPSSSSAGSATERSPRTGAGTNPPGTDTDGDTDRVELVGSGAGGDRLPVPGLLAGGVALVALAMLAMSWRGWRPWRPWRRTGRRAADGTSASPRRAGAAAGSRRIVIRTSDASPPGHAPDAADDGRPTHVRL